MSNDEASTNTNDDKTNINGPPDTKPTTRSIFSVPPALKRVFDKFPLITYPENELPIRAPDGRDRHVLHVFTTPEDAKQGKPSFNPACLRWQVGQYGKIRQQTSYLVPLSRHIYGSRACPSTLLPRATTLRPLVFYLSCSRLKLDSRLLKVWKLFQAGN